MKSISHDKNGPTIFLRFLVLVLNAVTSYAYISLEGTAKIYDGLNNSLTAENPNVETIRLGDSDLTVPSYRFFTEDNLWALTSKENRLKDEKGFTLIDIPVTHGDEALPMKIAATISDNLQRLVNAAEADGEPLMVSSAHRTFAEQEATHQAFVAKNGSALVDTYVMPVGASEHHTGLAVDFSSVSKQCKDDSNDCSLSQTGASWLAQNAQRFGFVQRYPEGKQKITGVGFEPWHYRYVGRPLAEALTNSGLTLEEAVERIAPGYSKLQ